MSALSTSPTVKRIITTHEDKDIDGSKVSLISDQVPLKKVLDTDQGTAHVGILYSHLGLPTTNPHHITSDTIITAQNAVKGVVLPSGVNGQITQLSPGFRVDYHRTSSVDYNIFLSGSAFLITPTVDGKEERTEVKAGEVVVQTGTIHAWEAGKNGARWCTVVVAAKPVEVEGQALKDVDF